jgi:hypothetical protein
MELSDILSQSGGLQSIARDLGISEAEAASGAAALTPAILGGIEKQAQAQPNGLEGLEGLLGQLGGGGLLDNLLSPEPTNVNQGNNVLGQIFGSKDVSRTVAQHASTQSGVSPQILKKMLPLLAMLVTGYLARKRSSAAPAQAPRGGGGGLGGLLGGLLGGGGGGLGSLFGGSGGGNPLDDILRQAGSRG